jgi:hypothetical protein
MAAKGGACVGGGGGGATVGAVTMIGHNCCAKCKETFEFSPEAGAVSLTTLGCCSALFHLDCAEALRGDSIHKAVFCPNIVCNKPVKFSRPPSDYSFFVGDGKKPQPFIPDPFIPNDNSIHPSDPMKNWDKLRDFLFDFGHQYKQHGQKVTARKDGEEHEEIASDDNLPLIAWHVARYMNNIQDDYLTARSAVDVYSRLIAEAVETFLRKLLGNLSDPGPHEPLFNKLLAINSENYRRAPSELKNIIAVLVDDKKDDYMWAIHKIVNTNEGNARHYNPDHSFRECSETEQGELDTTVFKLINCVYNVAFKFKSLLQVKYAGNMASLKHRQNWTNALDKQVQRSKERAARNRASKLAARPPSKKSFLGGNPPTLAFDGRYFFFVCVCMCLCQFNIHSL